jgi:hypothetical protein
LNARVWIGSVGVGDRQCGECVVERGRPVMVAGAIAAPACWPRDGVGES